MAITETEAIIIGSMVATVITIVSGILLWYFCGGKSEEKVKAPNYSKIHPPTTDTKEAQNDTTLVTSANNESSVIIHVVESDDDEEDDEMLIQSSNPILSSADSGGERTNTMNTTQSHTVKQHQGPQNTADVSERTQNIDHVTEVDGILKQDPAITIERSKTNGDEQIIEIPIERSNINNTDTDDAAPIDTTHTKGNEDHCIECVLDAEQIKIEQYIASHLLSDEESSDTWSESSGSSQTFTWTGSPTSAFSSTVTSSVKWREYRANLKNLFDLFSGNKAHLSWNAFNTFLEIVVATNANRWNLELDKKLTHDEFVEFFCTKNIKKHIEKQVSWKLLILVWNVLHEIDVTSTGLLDCNSFRSFGAKLDLNYNEIEVLWKQINKSGYVTVADVFEWFKQRLQALKQHASSSSSSRTDSDGGSEITATHPTSTAIDHSILSL